MLFLCSRVVHTCFMNKRKCSSLFVSLFRHFSLPEYSILFRSHNFVNLASFGFRWGPIFRPLGRFQQILPSQFGANISITSSSITYPAKHKSTPNNAFTLLIGLFTILYYGQQTNNYFTNYLTPTCFDTTESSSRSL